jgi:hypothetical protein
MAGTIRNLTWLRRVPQLRCDSVAHLVVLSLCMLFLSFETLHPAADLLHANTHRAAATAGAGAGGLLNNDLSESHSPYVADVHPVVTIPPLEGHQLLVPPAFRAEDAYQEPPFHVPV